MDIYQRDLLTMIQPYDRPSATRSARSLVLGSNGMVCSSQPLASQTGLNILRQGGNAFDAAVAMAASLNVVEPMSTGIGGDMYVLAWSARDQKLIGLNGSGRCASTANLEYFRHKGCDSITGIDTVTVPGTVHGWVTLLDEFGSLSLADTLADSIRYAEEGFPVSEVIAQAWIEGLRFKGRPEFAQTYLIPEGNGWRSPRLGEVFRQTDIANTLRSLASGGIDAFYHGEIADKIASYLEAEGSLLRASDLADHSSTWVEPVSTDFGGYQLFELPPNGQGIVALEMLNILEGYDLAALGHNSAEYIHVLTEAKKLAYTDRDSFVTDLDVRKLPVEQLISKEYANRQRARIDTNRAQSFPESKLEIGDDTVYLATADRDGNMVSFINSTYDNFGSGYVVPGTGISLQNRGALFSLEENHLNRIEPSKRPLHTIIPAMVMRENKPVFCYGVMGGEMQPQGHVQVFLNMFVFGMNAQEAGEAARTREADGAIEIESGISDAVSEGLRNKGHKVKRSVGQFGGYQGIYYDAEQGVYHGASENRKDGCAMGY
ncbi:MAG: gamma-glutamyltransferase [Gammaproteobacteria bacterium]